MPRSGRTRLIFDIRRRKSTRFSTITKCEVRDRGLAVANYRGTSHYNGEVTPDLFFSPGFEPGRFRAGREVLAVAQIDCLAFCGSFCLPARGMCDLVLLKIWSRSRLYFIFSLDLMGYRTV